MSNIDLLGGGAEKLVFANRTWHLKCCHSIMTRRLAWQGYGEWRINEGTYFFCFYHHILRIGVGKTHWKLREREEEWLLLLTLEEGFGSHRTQKTLEEQLQG